MQKHRASWKASKAKMERPKTTIASNTRAKIGRKTMLTSSLRRKVVRLYFFTNTDLKDICALVTIGRKGGAKRTIQGELNKMLHVHYNDMRPKTSDERRRRVIQVKACAALRPRSRNDRQEFELPRGDALSLENSSPPIHSHADSSKLKAGSTFEVDQYDSEAAAAQTDYCLKAIQPKECSNRGCHVLGAPAGESIDPHPLSQHPKATNSWRHVSDNPHPRPIAGPQRKVIDETSLHTSCSSSRPGSLTLATVFQTFQGAKSVDDTGAEEVFSDLDLEGINLILPGEARAGPFGERCGRGALEARQRPIRSHTKYEEGFRPSFGSNGRHEDSWSPTLSPNEEVIVTQRLCSDNNATRPQAPVMAIESSTRRCDSQTTKSSALSEFIEQLPYSGSHKQAVKDLYGHYSSSTSSFSIGRTSAHSRRSSIQTQSSFEEDQRNDLTVKGAWSFSNVKRIRPVMDPVVLPGYFITTHVNNFAHHIDCIAKTPGNSRLSWCEGCCRKSSFFRGERKQSFPYAVMRHKMDENATEDFSHMKIGWSDRFGNSSLHIAAALGTDYRNLSSIIDRGANINAVNTAGQTFLHVLDPKKVIYDMRALMHKMTQLDFNFWQCDHQGDTIAHSLAKHDYRCLQFLPAASLWSHRDNAGQTAYSSLYLDEMRSLGEHCEEHKIVLPTQLDPELVHQATYESTSEENTNNSASLQQQQGEMRAVVFNAYKNTHAEDSQGRNALHIIPYIDWKLSPQMESRPYNPGKHRMDATKHLIAAHVNLNGNDAAGCTSLMAYIQSSHLENAEMATLVDTLISAGASLERRNRKGESALHIAVAAGRITATKVLLRHGANVHARNSDGRGVLACKMSMRHPIDPDDYAKINACMAQVMAAGGAAEPNELQEWSLPELQR